MHDTGLQERKKGRVHVLHTAFLPMRILYDTCS